MNPSIWERNKFKKGLSFKNSSDLSKFERIILVLKKFCKLLTFSLEFQKIFSITDFLTVGQNNFGNKIPLLRKYILFDYSTWNSNLEQILAAMFLEFPCNLLFFPWKSPYIPFSPIFLQGPVASYLLLTSSVISFLGSLFYGENESAAEVAPPEIVAAEWRSFHQKPEVNLVNEIFCQKKK